MTEPSLKSIIEGALIAAGTPLSIERILALFDDHERPDRAEVLQVIQALSAEYRGRGIELVEVAGGYRVQVCASVARWVARLWEEPLPRYSRALLETLAIIAYRQPVTRREIESIRGVSLNTAILKTLDERGWIRVVGHRDVPGRPALYGTTRQFLDDFGLRTLDELPPLSAINSCA